jgi:fatty acid/phospholipid biosynthesis enzyme
MGLDNVARPAMRAATVALTTHTVVNVTLVGERTTVAPLAPHAREDLPYPAHRGFSSAPWPGRQSIGRHQ